MPEHQPVNAESDEGILAPRCPHCGWQAIDREDAPENYEAAKADVVEHKTKCPASTHPAEKDAALDRAIRTLLPGLRLANYVERWAVGSPAVQALSILSEHVGEGTVAAGETVDPEVTDGPRVSSRRPPHPARKR